MKRVQQIHQQELLTLLERHNKTIFTTLNIAKPLLILNDNHLQITISPHALVNIYWPMNTLFYSMCT